MGLVTDALRILLYHTYVHTLLHCYVFTEGYNFKVLGFLFFQGGALGEYFATSLIVLEDKREMVSRYEQIRATGHAKHSQRGNSEVVQNILDMDVKSTFYMLNEMNLFLVFLLKV